MTKHYSFSSDKEPTEKQLEQLMLDVLQDVKERAAKAEEKFKTLHAQKVQQTLEHWRLKTGQNGSK